VGDGFDSGGTGEEGGRTGGLTNEESFDGEDGVGTDGDLRRWTRERGSDEGRKEREEKEE